MSEKYFLGAMTQNGFSTEFGKIMADKEYFTFILKGGAGTGKSSLMKKIAAEFEPTEDVTRFYCSSDPASLDAIVLHTSKAIICDGTAPHVMECSYPGVCQKIINLGEYWDEEKLKAFRSEIIEVTDKNKSLLARSKRFTTALSNVCFDTYNCGEGCLLEEKLKSFTERSAKRLLNKKGSGSGKTDLRQLTALTEYGCMTQLATLDSYLDVFAMNDDYYAASHKFVTLMAQQAVKRGYDVILCPAILFGNTLYEHLLILEAGIAFVINSPISKLDGFEKAINMGRFYDKKKISALKTRLRLDKVTASDLAEEVYSGIKKAKKVHDEIEKYYIAAMDHTALNKVCDSISREIHERTIK